MKKLVSIVLAVLMLLGGFSAIAEEDVVPAEETALAVVEYPAPFTFRGGLTWGLSLDEVIAIEGAKPAQVEEYSYHVTKAVFNNRPLSSYTCNITYWFVDGGLQQSQILLEDTWTFQSMDHPAIIDNLSPSLEAVYGEPLDLDAASDPFVAAYDAVCFGKKPSPYTIVSFGPFSRFIYRLWQPTENSTIAIIAHNEALYLHYLNTDIDWDLAINEPEPDIIPIDTTGL